jgi:pimeloyl-ACP methyl ester carboxylesterase
MVMRYCETMLDTPNQQFYSNSRQAAVQAAAEPLVIIPGFMSDARSFMPQIVALGAKRPIIVLPASLAETVEQHGINAARHLPTRFALLGHGLGGNIAIEILRRMPKAVTRIALIATDPLPEPPQIAAAREVQVVAARSGKLAEAVARETPEAALVDSTRRADVLDLLQDMAAGLGPDQFQRQSRALQRRPDQQKALRMAGIPALILAGAADPIISLRRAEFLAGLMPKGYLEIIENAGHLPQLERPEAVTQALDIFFSGRLPPLLLR